MRLARARRRRAGAVRLWIMAAAVALGAGLGPPMVRGTSDTSPPPSPPPSASGGVVIGGAALRPGALQTTAWVPESDTAQDATQIRGFGVSGTGPMSEIPDWFVPGTAALRRGAWTGDGTYFALARSSDILIYGVSPSGLRQVASLPLSAADLAPAPGPDLWALDGAVARYLAWDGTGYRVIPGRSVSDGWAPSAISAAGLALGGDVLVILDGADIRYLRNAGDAYRAVPGYGANVPEAISVAATGDGGYAVLLRDAANPGQGNRVRYYAIDGGAARPLPEFQLDFPAFQLASVPSDWGERDFAALDELGLTYYSWSSGGTWRVNLSRSIRGRVALAVSGTLTITATAVPNPAMRGQEVLVSITTEGQPERVEVALPPAFSQDLTFPDGRVAHYNHPPVPTATRLSADLWEYRFVVPWAYYNPSLVPDGDYTIGLTAYKGGSTATGSATVTVSGNAAAPRVYLDSP